MDSPLLHVANILYLISYSVRDILWLRVMTILAMLCLGWVYWTCNAEGAEYALGWQVAFLFINLIQVGLLILERRPVILTDVQKKLHSGPLSTLTPRQVQRFTDKAEWCTLERGEYLIHEDQKLANLVLILSGEANVQSKGESIARLGAGQFAGEMSFLTQGNTTADVIADSTLLYAKWSETYINDVMNRDHELATALQSALGTDLVKKVLKGREEIT